MDLRPMAFTRLLRAAKATEIALEESVKLKSDNDPTATPLPKSTCKFWLSLPDQQARLDAEAQARREASIALAGADWYRVFTFLKGLTTEYQNSGKNTLFVSIRLFFALLGYFREYAAEFDIEVPQNDGKRTLERALVQLVAILPASCFREGYPEYGLEGLITTTWSRKAVMLAVKHFLILKAEEKVPGATDSSVQNQRTGYLLVNGTPSSSDDVTPAISQASTCQLLPQIQPTPIQTTRSATTGLTIAPGSLKRKRSGSRTSIFNTIFENAQDLNSLCREQEAEITKLKPQVRSQEGAMGEIAKLKSKLQSTDEDDEEEEMVEHWKSNVKTLRQENAAMVTKYDIKASRTRRLQNGVRTLQQERDAVKQAWKFEIARKQAMKEMLMVSGGFRAESVEIAAKAISEGKRARDAIADIYRSGDGEMVD